MYENFQIHVIPSNPKSFEKLWDAAFVDKKAYISLLTNLISTNLSRLVSQNVEKMSQKEL